MKLDNKGVYSIFVVGTGATGSQLLPFLMQLCNNFKDNKVTIFDQDIFEEKNLKNQKCTKRDIGAPKARVLCERYNKVYPRVKLRYVDKYVVCKDDLLPLIKRSTIYGSIPILVSCVDNNASRKILHDVFMDKSIEHIIYVDAGNGTIEREGQVVVGYKTKLKGPTHIRSHSFGEGYDKAKELCAGSIIVQKPVCMVYPSILKDNDKIENLTSCTQVVDEHPQNIATNIMSASTIFNILNNIITYNEINAHIVNFSAETSVSVVKKTKYKDNTDITDALLNGELVAMK